MEPSVPHFSKTTIRTIRENVKFKSYIANDVSA